MSDKYDVIMSYDISVGKTGVSRHTEIKNELIQKLKYFDRWKKAADSEIYYLPNTVLWKRDTTRSLVFTDLTALIDEINKKHNDNIVLERFIALRWDDNNWNTLTKGKEHGGQVDPPIKP
jgi:hypothetical protein